MLSSIVSLSSSSKGFVGLFYIGAHVVLSTVLAGVSGVKNGLSATSTTEIILSPTNCVLSNGTLSHPYVAAMGCATVIFATLFFILRAKGFSYTSPCSPGPPPSPTPPSPEYPVPSISNSSPGAVPPAHNHSGMGSEPPSPPPDPGSDSADDTPRRNPWWLLLLLIVFAAGSYIYFTRSSDSSPLLIAGRITSTMDKYISDGWTAAVSAISTTKIYILRHGRQITKILLLGLATHCVCFVVFAILRRLRLLASAIDPASNYPAAFLVVFSLLMMASSPHFRSCLWLEYYNGYQGGVYPSIREINFNVSRLSSYLSSLVASHLNEVSVSLVIGGVTLAHAIAVSLRGSIRIASGIPFVTKVALTALSDPSVFCGYVGLCVGHSLVQCFVILLFAASRQYDRLNPTVKQHLWQWFSCPKSRASIRVTFLVLAQRHRQWKSGQIADFYELIPGFKYTLVATFKASLEIWSNIPIPQKLLIAAPAIIFYGYLYIIPVARSVSRRILKFIRIRRRQ
ncbi:hypothetical protein C8F04DRAFT_1105209 [Mycena alexandri]|uniref:Uncharacterized protein n=1 Tax=Mycena alexandri TaxID=1745969 RepID=A0AAD6SVE6_9AGAR|nr:hypothetical protein C8F04DRAFT_1105209 [Mycena alexandri]